MIPVDFPQAAVALALKIGGLIGPCPRLPNVDPADPAIVPLFVGFPLPLPLPLTLPFALTRVDPVGLTSPEEEEGTLMGNPIPLR